MDKQITHINEEPEKDIFDSFDLERFWYVLKRSRYWIFGFVVLATSLSYLYVRYTKPVYKSESIIKLDFESEANVLGLVDANYSQERNEISGEIELIRSRLFLSRVVQAANMEVSYHVYGRYLTDERYGNSPFVVSYKVLNESFYDMPIDLKVEDENTFILAYQYGSEEFSQEFKFGQAIKTPHFNLQVDKTNQFGGSIGQKFFFIINSENALIDFLQNTLEVVPENFNAQTIKISFSDFKAQKARNLVNLVDSLYMDYTKEVKNQVIEQKIKFLDDQIEQTEERLTKYEEYFEEFTIKNRTNNLSADLTKTIQQLALLDSQKYFLKRKIADLDLLEKQVSKKGAIVVGPLTLEALPSSLSKAISEYAELQQERELKLASYNETSYLVQQLNLKMEKAQDQLNGILDAYMESLDDRLSQVDIRRKVLESNLSQLPSMGTEYAKNKRFYDLQEESMLNLQTSKMGLEITKAGTVTKNVILSPASLPTVPIKPQKALIIGAGFMIGLILSVVFLLIRYLAHNKIAGLRELEKLVNVPVLGAIPNYKTPLEQTALVVDKETTSSISEALRTIRTNMDFIDSSTGSKIISVTSTVSGEGKTFIAVNLGAIMAMTGKKICVVDIDMRKPKIHLALGKNGRANGVSTILAGKSVLSEGIQKTRLENLFYVSAGPTPPNPSELLLQEEFDKLLEELKGQFDIVILDTPPVGLVTDGRLVMKKSDIQLYVARADYSKRSFTKVLNDLKAAGQFSNLTTILNAIDHTPVYGYGYGYGYGYYEKEETKVKKIASSLKSLF